MVTRKAPAIILPLTLLLLLPIISLFVACFWDETGQVTLAPLRTLLLTSRQLSLLKTSLILAGGTSFFCVLVGVPFAFLLERTDLPLRRFFIVGLLFPLAVPSYIHAIVWARLLDPKRLLFSDSLGTILSLPSIYSVAGGIFVLTLSFFPFVTLVTWSGLRSIETSLEESSLMSRGATATIGRITLPLVTPHITCGAILVFLFSFINFEASDILRLKVYPMEIFVQFSAYYDERAATLLSVPLIAVTLLVVWGQMFLMRGKSYVSFGRRGDRRSVFHLGRWKPLWLLFAFIVIAVSGAVPIVTVVKGAGSFENYADAVYGSMDCILYSAYLSLASSLAMVVFSFAVAYYLERGRGPIRSLVDYLTQVPFGIPSIVLGIGLIRVWNREGFDWIYGSSLILALAFVTAYSPFTIKIISAKLKQIRREWEEAALLSSPSHPRILRRIVLPLTLPGIMAGFLAGFVFSLSNLGAALLVVGPGKTTLPITIYNFMHYGAEEAVFALSTVMVILMALLLAFLYSLYRVFGKRAGL